VDNQLLYYYPVKKKVLFICKGHQNVAGAQLYLKTLSEILPSDKYDLHYAFYAGDGKKVFDEISESNSICTWEYDWRHLSFYDSFNQSRLLYKKVNPDFVIFNSSEDEIIPPIIAAKTCGIKNKVMVVHWATREDSLPLLVKKANIPINIPSRYAIRTRLKRFIAYSLLDKLIFVNNGTRRAFLKLYYIKPSKCKTIYNGINARKYNIGHLRESFREKLDVGRSEIMLLATGNLTAVKGHAVLISAIKLLVERGRSLKCFIAGQGELEEQLKKKITDNNLTENIKLLGYRNDVAELLTAADIFVMPSLNEALGYSILEAMASGKPVVASGVGGIPEVIADGEEGILTAPGDIESLSNAIDSLMSDKATRERMGKACSEKVNKIFLVEDMLKQTKEFIQI
jgi:glycosyltransferase involved in cell wall biosynthesis